MRFNILVYGVDQTGIGEGEVARAKRDYGDRVVGVIFTPQTRLMRFSRHRKTALRVFSWVILG